MTDTRPRPAHQLAAARHRIVAEMDMLQQLIGNLDAAVASKQNEITDLTHALATARAEEAGLRTALAAIGPAATKRRRANGAPKAAPGPKLKAAIPAPAGVAAMPTNGEALP